MLEPDIIVPSWIVTNFLFALPPWKHRNKPYPHTDTVPQTSVFVSMKWTQYPLTHHFILLETNKCKILQACHGFPVKYNCPTWKTWWGSQKCNLVSIRIQYLRRKPALFHFLQPSQSVGFCFKHDCLTQNLMKITKIWFILTTIQYFWAKLALFHFSHFLQLSNLLEFAFNTTVLPRIWWKLRKCDSFWSNPRFEDKIGIFPLFPFFATFPTCWILL